LIDKYYIDVSYIIGYQKFPNIQTCISAENSISWTFRIVSMYLINKIKNTGKNDFYTDNTSILKLESQK
jgi:hypothetical protein